MLANILAAFALLALIGVTFGPAVLLGVQLLPLGIALAVAAWLASRLPKIP